jgi:hypothetical protein
MITVLSIEYFFSEKVTKFTFFGGFYAKRKKKKNAGGLQKGSGRGR